MTAKILTIAQQKGGAGKTTLVAQLAATFAAMGNRVAVMDIDPQGSLTAWAAIRAEQPKNKVYDITHVEVAGWRVSGEVDKLADDHDFVFIDSPPHAETEAKIAVRAADLVVIPVQPSPADVWATRPTVDLAETENVPILVVMNRVPPRSNLVALMHGLLKKQKLPIAKTTIGNRVAFASSMMEGRSVVETAKSSAAAAEMQALAKELTRKAKARK